MTSPNLPDRWELDRNRGIVWHVSRDTRLPHEDHVEMSGLKVSVIVRYRVEADGRLKLTREIIWPMLRLKKDDVRGYLRRTYGDEVRPRLLLDGEEIELGPLTSVQFNGVLTLIYRPLKGVDVYRILSPSVDQPMFVERWFVWLRAEVRYQYEKKLCFADEPQTRTERDQGVYGDYEIGVRGGPFGTDNTSCEFLFFARRADETVERVHAFPEINQRLEFVKSIRARLRLETPDPVLNRAFDFAKLRAAESVFDTKMGLVHSPGGGRYYGGIWANDQAEYSGPFFPFLGDKRANAAALNAYRIFAGDMTPDYEMLPSSFEVEGDVRFHAGGDRGDAAMVAYGASRFALAAGSLTTARELWPAIQWCLEYCRRKTNTAGVVESDTDELEGRFPTGNANLSTSTLAYGALRSAADLAWALNKPVEATEYNRRADALHQAIESYFGATVEGFATYRYYDGNTVLRSWICLPLTMGLLDRKEGTVAALLSPRLWSDDGLVTQAGDTVFWDRATLYGLRGLFAAGETETALRTLTAYTHRRLLGDHVPYPVEAFPEGGQAHLSAESALYCRVITEGLFGITPTGPRAFHCLPRLPQKWPAMHLRSIRAFGRRFDLTIERDGSMIRLTIQRSGGNLLTQSLPEGEPFDVTLT